MAFLYGEASDVGFFLLLLWDIVFLFMNLFSVIFCETLIGDINCLKLV